MEKYGQLSVKQLIIELKKGGAKCTGRKEQLIQRLADYERNDNFNREYFDAQEPQSLNWPCKSLFSSVNNNSTSPSIDIVDVNEYFSKVYDSKEGQSMCSAVHRKGYSMMDQNYLAALIECHEERWYYQGQVNSEFTKSLTYFTKVIVEDDGKILETNCECVAGAGTRAVCKHVAVLCYAILRFRDRGVWQLRKTCTEKSQTWHMPKKMKVAASPQKAEQLTFHVPDYNDQNKKKTGNMCYDPRLLEHRNDPSFSDSARNRIIAYTAGKNRPLGISGCIPAACMPAFAVDHDYLKRPVLHQMIWNRLEHMAKTATSLEKTKRKQSQSKEWHEARQYLVTASSVGQIVHMTDRRNKEAFADNLVNPKPLKSAAINWGRRKEADAKAEYERRSNNRVQPCGLFISETHPFIGGSPDGLVAVVTTLEVKCPYSIRDEVISAQNLSYLEERNQELHLKKTSNYYQVQTQLFVSKREFCDFCVWTNVDFKRLFVERDEGVIKMEIVPKVEKFYNDFMLPALVKKFFPMTASIA